MFGAVGIAGAFHIPRPKLLSFLKERRRWQMQIQHPIALALLVLVQVTVSHDALAQAATVLPGQLSQVPAAPEIQKTLPDIRIARPGSVSNKDAAGPAVRVDSLHISGQTRFSEATLVAATGFLPGRSFSLSDLRHMAALISQYYNARGYIVAQAYVPAQEIKGGAVTIAVIEGHYGAIDLSNQSGLRNGVAQAVLAGLKPGDLVDGAPLERRLLLLSDLPGVRVSSTLGPGAAVGTSDLRVKLSPGPLFSGDLEADNAGDPYTGRYRGGGTLNLNDPLGIGDIASVRVLTSGSGFQYVRGSYQAQLGVATVGAAYAYFHYRLGRQFSALDADGREQVVSLFASYPLIRSYNDNLRVVIDGDYRAFQDRIGVTSTLVDRRARVVTFGWNGDHRDRLGGGGSDAFKILGTVGDLNIETASARAIDAATARTQGSYAKVNFSLDRLQNIAGPFQLYASVNGQVASKNLDISEKMELGGAYGVRAYPDGEAYGDEGYVATLEARVWLPRPLREMPGVLQLAVFGDTGWVRFAVNRWAGGPNTARRSGVGVGLTWAKAGDFLARVSYAHSVETVAPTSTPDTNGEFLFQVIKFF